MRPPIFFVLTLLTAAAASAAPPAADSPLARERRVSAALLAADARLRQKVSLACNARPMEGVLADLQQKLGIPLAATADTRDEKLTAYLDDREAASVLRLIAEHVGFVWSKSGQGYRLSQGELARREEARILQAEDDAQWDLILQQLRAISALRAEPEKLKARREEITPKLRQQGIPAAERAELSSEFGKILMADFPGAGVALKAFGALTPLQVSALRSGRSLQASTFDGSLSPTLAEEIKTAVGNRAGQLGDGPNRQVDLIICLTKDRSWITVPEQAAEHPMSLVIAMPVGTLTSWFPCEWSPGAPRRPEPPPRETRTEDPTLLKKVTIAAPKRPGEPQPRPTWKEDLPTVGDVAEALHRDAGLEVIADAYVRARLSAPPGETTALQALDTVAAKLAYTWEREGGVVRLRSRIAARDRRAEVPERLLGPCREAIRAAGTVTLDDLASLAAPLTDAEGSGLCDYWGWYFEKTPLATTELATGFRDARPDLLVWSTLGRDQRRAALAGEPVPLPKMAPQQRGAFLRALAPAPFQRPDRIRFKPLGPTDDLTGASFRLGVEELRLQRLRHVYGRGIAAESLVPFRPDGSYPGNLGADNVETVGSPFRVGQHTFTYVVLANEEPRRKRTLRLPRPSAPKP